MHSSPRTHGGAGGGPPFFFFFFFFGVFGVGGASTSTVLVGSRSRGWGGAPFFLRVRGLLIFFELGTGGADNALLCVAVSFASLLFRRIFFAVGGGPDFDDGGIIELRRVDFFFFFFIFFIGKGNPCRGLIII